MSKYREETVDEMFGIDSLPRGRIHLASVSEFSGGEVTLHLRCSLPDDKLAAAHWLRATNTFHSAVCFCSVDERRSRIRIQKVVRLPEATLSKFSFDSANFRYFFAQSEGFKSEAELRIYRVPTAILKVAADAPPGPTETQRASGSLADKLTAALLGCVKACLESKANKTKENAPRRPSELFLSPQHALVRRLGFSTAALHLAYLDGQIYALPLDRLRQTVFGGPFVTCAYVFDGFVGGFYHRATEADPRKGFPDQGEQAKFKCSQSAAANCPGAILVAAFDADSGICQLWRLRLASLQWRRLVSFKAAHFRNAPSNEHAKLTVKVENSGLVSISRGDQQYRFLFRGSTD